MATRLIRTFFFFFALMLVAISLRAETNEGAIQVDRWQVSAGVDHLYDRAVSMDQARLSQVQNCNPARLYLARLSGRDIDAASISLRAKSLSTYQDIHLSHPERLRRAEAALDRIQELNSELIDRETAFSVTKPDADAEGEALSTRREMLLKSKARELNRWNAKLRKLTGVPAFTGVTTGSVSIEPDLRWDLRERLFQVKLFFIQQAKLCAATETIASAPIEALRSRTILKDPRLSDAIVSEIHSALAKLDSTTR